jgi:hypothetical protein
MMPVMSAIHAKVKVRIHTWENEDRVYKVVETTPGRMPSWQIFCRRNQQFLLALSIN